MFFGHQISHGNKWRAWLGVCVCVMYIWIVVCKCLRTGSSQKKKKKNCMEVIILNYSIRWHKNKRLRDFLIFSLCAAAHTLDNFSLQQRQHNQQSRLYALTKISSSDLCAVETRVENLYKSTAHTYVSCVYVDTYEMHAIVIATKIIFGKKRESFAHLCPGCLFCFDAGFMLREMMYVWCQIYKWFSSRIYLSCRVACRL